MALFKCKMCGGNLEILGNQSIAQCDSCGTDQTLPRLDDDRKVNLYDRANHLRRNNEYDKAEKIYDEILNEDQTDAEAYWSLVLCQYGIEYVEEPRTYRRIPTVNRAQYTSIYADENFKAALTYSDPHQREIYEKEAEMIDEIQKGILKVSREEEPFDVFISYKESDDNRNRTPDSVLANELYHHLTNEGFKVFFSRITLENKLGVAYEPYIFSALNSAKVMVVIGTKEEYFNAVWVRNEWNRYLSLIKKGEDKTLIPAYRDMDPYDLPGEFSHLQALDMSTLGFMQDLIRGIKKIIKKDEPAPREDVTFLNNTANTINPLLRRAYIFLEDGEFSKADEICEQILNLNPEEPEAYLIKLMADCEFNKIDDFASIEDGKFVLTIRDNNNYKRLRRYGDAELIQKVHVLFKKSTGRIKENLLSERYHTALKLIGSEKVDDIIKGIKMFEKLEEYKDSQIKIDEGKVNIYDKAVLASNSEYLPKLRESLTYFDMIPDFRDVHVKIEETKDKIRKVEQEQEEERRKENERLEGIYNHAMAKYNSDDVHVIIEGKKEFLSLGGFKDSKQMIVKANEKVYQSAMKFAKSRRTSKLKIAIEQFSLIEGYKDSKRKIAQSQDTIAKNRKRTLKYRFTFILILNFIFYLFINSLNLNINYTFLSIIIILIILYQGLIAKSYEWNSKWKMFFSIVFLFVWPLVAIPIMTVISIVKLIRW